MLYVMATPIGNTADISQRALQILEQCQNIVGEERKELSKRMRAWGFSGKSYHLLNEHSQKEDISALLDLCQTEDVVLMSDCGTPGFCDPGAVLVQGCRQQGVSIRSVPGPSSLMTFLSLCGHRLDRFHFEGFLPAKKDARQVRLKDLKKLKVPVILMDTPYRLQRSIEDMRDFFPHRPLVLGYDLSMESETVLEGTAEQLLSKIEGQKAPFVLAVLT